jgi:hypothetical protein
MISRALHLHAFDQPVKKHLFNTLLMLFLKNAKFRFDRAAVNSRNASTLI